MAREAQARVSNAEIRASVVYALDAGARIPDRQPLVRGANLVRRGRWAVGNTTTPGLFVACEVTEDGIGAGILIGDSAFVLRSVPDDVRTAWEARQYTETDEDPPDALPARLR